MDFIKMQGVGNDYIFIDKSENYIKNARTLSIILSDRHYGVGSDGLVTFEPSDKGLCKMRIYNTDGSEAGVCGNALRCLGKLLWDEHYTDESHFFIETESGIKEVWLNIENGEVVNVSVDMGRPTFSAELIPMNIKEDRAINYPLSIDGKVLKITALSMGNPHCVIIDNESVTNEAFLRLGKLIEHSKIFPSRTNVEFVKIIDRKTIEMRVWERGVGETLGCGSGACAAMVASNINGLIDDECFVIMSGGELKISYISENNGRVVMTGEAVRVFKGQI